MPERLTVLWIERDHVARGITGEQQLARGGEDAGKRVAFLRVHMTPTDLPCLYVERHQG